ncbi:MAG: hypothetical protein IKK57_02855 [Clostridia bacterium]|nr:hypothetical protein [Clostridia bacterium]
MKKILAAALAMVLCLCMGAAAAESGENGATAVFATTQAFMEMLDEAEIDYVYRGLDQDGDEHIAAADPDKNISYTIHYYFEDDLQHTAIFVWNIITFDPADTLRVMHLCSGLNYDYNYTCWYVDETDNTVTCSMNLIYRDENVGQVVTEATLYLMRIIESAYPSLSVYDK